MTIVSEYLNEKMYFNDFEEIKKHYNYNDAYDLDDLQDYLQEQYNGTEYPKLTLTNNFEVECWWRGNNFNSGYYDTIEEAKEVFEKILEEMEEIKVSFKEANNKEKFINQLEENDEPVDYIQINKFDEFENVEVQIEKEIKWK